MEERDRMYRGIIATEISPFSLMPKEDYKKKNDTKKWAYRRYPEYDPNFICISTDGTLGEIWQVGDLKIGLPSSEGKEILNIDKSDDDSVWQRTEIPRDFINLEVEFKRQMRKVKGLKRNDVKKKYVLDRDVLEKKHHKFIEQEQYRRKNGLFVKIDNQICYITGENYMFLNYYYLTEDKIYPNFRITAMHTWWHWEAVCADSQSWGELRLKSRRVAWTVEACSIALNKLTKVTYAEIPIVSETDRLASMLFTNKIVNPFQYYPTYFLQLTDDPNNKAKNNLEITFDTDQQEVSTISYYPTKDVAYDSTKATYSINDEVGKYTNVTFTEFRGNHKDCHFKGMTQIVGKGKFGSTAGSFANGGESYQYEFEEASAKNRDEMGRTNTGLISLFVDDCYTSAGYFDKWGYPIVFDPQEPIENEEGSWIEFGSISVWNMTAEKMKKGDKSDYNNFLRQHPRTPEHAFRNEGGVNNDFDIDNLNTHYDFLNNLTPMEKVERIFVGNLDWEGEEFNSKVIWKPNPEGRFKTTWIPDKDMQNKSHKINFHGKTIVAPMNNHIGAFGVDSYDIVGTTDDGSDGTIVGYTKFNMVGAPSNSFMLIYKERPKKRNDFYDDVIKACVFFGFYALIESNKPRLLEYMYDKGYTGYSMRRQDKKWKDLKDYEKLWGGIPSSQPVIEDQASLLKDYIVDNIGVNVEDECNVWFIELITEWIHFNLKKRKKFDLGVASGLAKMASQYQTRKRTTVDFFEGKGLSLKDFSA